MDGFQIDWLYGLIGGIAIGSASALYLFFNGRIAGISGILGNFLSQPMNLSAISFLVGLILIPAIAVRSVWETEITVTDHIPVIILGGLLVGLGTRLGSGCTSGHGVCGMSRLSIRSITATCTFMLFAGITVFITRHMIGGF